MENKLPGFDETRGHLSCVLILPGQRTALLGQLSKICERPIEDEKDPMYCLSRQPSRHKNYWCSTGPCMYCGQLEEIEKELESFKDFSGSNSGA
ncbi:hypothetical protein GCK32_002649 [Trichostrongylus colubriformis]|uniref:Uncharacterized protein n=1 Tax=Trichostrongylus colubriformis TaxID=6319 RepID=A0AAN8FDR5_TRICO